MALPKRRHSRSRRDKSRAHIRLASPALTRCPECGAVKLSHRICMACGTYKGRKILVIPVKAKKESAAAR